MSGIGTGYDLSSTTFSPDGRVFQVEYAQKAVENSGTVVGLRCKDGVVLAVEKIIPSKLLVPGTMRRAHLVDTHAGLAVCGLLADGRQLVVRAREECAQYRDSFGAAGGEAAAGVFAKGKQGSAVIPGHVLAERVANFVHLYTLYWHVRPFGCAVLLATYEKEPQLYLVEPSGVCYRYFACAVGKGKMVAKTELEKIDSTTITAREAVKELAKVIVGVHDDAKDKQYTLEMLWVCDESGRKAQMVPQELVEEAHQAAIKAAESDDEDMDDAE